LPIEIDLDEIGDELDKQASEIIMRIAVELSNLMKEEAPVHTGRLRQSIQILGKEEGKVVVGTNLKYAPRVQFGSDPRTPSIESLKRWAKLKLGAENLAYAIQMKIEEEGTEPNPFVSRAVERLKERYK